MRAQVKPSYPQLDETVLGLLTTRLEFHKNSRAALARELGVSRSGLSQAMDGRYPADTRKLRALIVEKLAEQVACPHLRVEIAPGVCKAARERPLSASSASRSDVKHWQACRLCEHNPARRAFAVREADHAAAL
jgi:DNA-binding transcriptional regulator YdaS (Cro superfamily)